MKNSTYLRNSLKVFMILSEFAEYVTMYNIHIYNLIFMQKQTQKQALLTCCKEFWLFLRDMLLCICLMFRSHCLLGRFYSNLT